MERRPDLCEEGVPVGDLVVAPGRPFAVGAPVTGLEHRVGFHRETVAKGALPVQAFVQVACPGLREAAAAPERCRTAGIVDIKNGFHFVVPMGQSVLHGAVSGFHDGQGRAPAGNGVVYAVGRPFQTGPS